MSKTKKDVLDFGEFEKVMTFDDFKSSLKQDYRLAYLSRQCSLLGRKEVLTGKAKFGIFGDGKELPQLAWSKGLSKWRLQIGLLPRPNLYDGY